MVIGCIAEWEDRILLCRRAIEPRLGLWTLPAGFMENGETVAQAALRETLEEANARVELAAMYSVLSVPHVNQVHIFYRGRLMDLDFGPGAESLDVALFAEADDSLEGARLPHDLDHAAALLRRPEVRRVRLSHRRDPPGPVTAASAARGRAATALPLSAPASR